MQQNVLNITNFRDVINFL